MTAAHDWQALMSAAYPDVASGRFSSAYDYRPMGDKFGQVLAWRSDDDYQGDTFAVIRDGSRYGFLKFGWGSCSGCDALQACHGMDDIATLARELYDGIVWCDTLPECVAYAERAEERNEWYAKSGAFLAFLDEIRGLS